MIDELQKWVTLGGAVIAAIASTTALVRSWASGQDSIKVIFGPLEPPCSPGESLHVMSLREHTIRLSDYGFVDRDGALLSLPDLLAHDPPTSEGLSIRGGESLEKRGALFEIGPIELRKKQVAAYAITVAQDRYVLGFSRDVPWYRRLWIKLKLWRQPQYQ